MSGDVVIEVEVPGGIEIEVGLIQGDDVATQAELNAEIAVRQANDDTLSMALGTKADLVALDAKADLVEGVVPDAQLPVALARDAEVVLLTQKGAANGVATLDGGGHVPDTQIPSGITRDSELAAAIAALVNSAPGVLDTIGELAAALQADESAAAALTALVALKAPLASPALTGTPTKNGSPIQSALELAAAYVPSAPGIDEVLAAGTLWRIPHKSGANIAPESSIEAADIAVAQQTGAGQPAFLDIDVIQGAASVFYNVHDGTWTRVTGSARNVSDTTVASLQTMAFIIPTPVLGGATVRPCTTETFLRKFHGRAIIHAEVKTAGQMTAFVALLNRLKFSKQHMVIETASVSDLAVAVASGYRTAFIAASGVGVDAAGLAAAGVKDVHVPFASSSSATITALHAAGLKANVYATTTMRRVDRATALGWGADGWTSEDWLHTYSTAPILATLGADQGVILPGMLPSNAGVRPTLDGGVRYNDAVTGTYIGGLLGHLGPLSGDKTIEFTWQFDSALAVGSHLNFAVLATDKQWSDGGADTGQTGFRALADMASGAGGTSTMKVQKTTDGAHTNPSGNLNTTTAIPNGGTFVGRLKIFPGTGTVRLDRRDAAGKVSGDAGADAAMAKAVQVTGITGLESGYEINFGRAGVSGRLVALTVA